MKATEQYFPLALFGTLHKEVHMFVFMRYLPQGIQAGSHYLFAMTTGYPCEEVSAYWTVTACSDLDSTS